MKFAFLGGIAPLFGGGIFLATSKAKNSYYSGPLSRHFNGDRFLNPGGVNPNGFGDLLKWKLLERPAKWPNSYPSPFAGANPKTETDALAITMIGHATLLIQTDGTNILTDPVFSQRASPVSFAGPKRVGEPGVAIEDLPKIDVILLSHNHYDHMDIASVKCLVADHDPIIITPLGNDTIILDSIPNARVQTGDWNDVVAFEKIRIHFEPMHHWSARGTSDRSMALWAAFVIEASQGKIYFVGDTGFHDGINYRHASEKHGGFKVAILPIGAYAPRWFMKAQHQNPEEAVEGHILCKAETSIAHHWGMFQLTNEPIEEPIERLATASAKAGLRKETFVILRPGEAWPRPVSS